MKFSVETGGGSAAQSYSSGVSWNERQALVSDAQRAQRNRWCPHRAVGSPMRGREPSICKAHDAEVVGELVLTACITSTVWRHDASAKVFAPYRLCSVNK